MNILFKLLLMLFFVVSVLSCASHRRVPNTILKTTYGVRKDSSVYLLLKYYMYYTPKGISRFPDGGRVKIIFEKYFLIKKTRSDFIKLHEFDLSDYYRITYDFIDLTIKNNFLYIKIKYYDKGSVEFKNTVLCYNLDSDTIEKTKNGIQFNRANRVSKTITAKYFQKLYDYAALGLPDPVPYISGGKTTDVKTIIEKKGNMQTRIALVGKYINKNDLKTLKKIFSETDENVLKEILFEKYGFN